MWWKQHKWKLIAPALAVVLLAAAFWYGGGAPGRRGWAVQPDFFQGAVSTERDSASDTQTPPEEPPLDGPSGEAPNQVAESTPTAPEQPEGESETGEKSSPPAQNTDSKTGKDSYLTDPMPEGKTEPVELRNSQNGTESYTCTISISCATILNNMDWLDPDKTELVPEDGWLLEPTQVTFYEGESVFHVLRRTCKQQKLHMEFKDTPMYNSAYIEGIGNLYEFDCGEQSGWMYAVNGWYPNYGCSRYQLKDGDAIDWRYTCDLGADIGGANVIGG